MGILPGTEWHAKWITAPGNAESILLRREFTVKAGLRHATVHICGLGQYELSANGTKVENDLLAPGWTQYRKTCLYDTLDLTPRLRPGENAIGIILGNGMYHIASDPVRYVKFAQSFGPLKAIAQIELEYMDGTHETVGTDSNWQAGPSPVTYNNIYGGEDYDARLERSGWDSPDFGASSQWAAAAEISGPGGELKGLSCAAPPIRAFEVFEPVHKRQLLPDLVVYDLGQNASMMVRLNVQGAAGSFVRVIPAELLKPDGTVDRSSATERGVRPAWWQFTLKGEGTEIYFPKFFYQGCRYLQVELHPADKETRLPEIKKIEGIVVHSAAKPIGEFSCSNPLFNAIYKLVRWAQLSNMQSLLTDCPTREKLGWLEQTHLDGPALRYNFDLDTLFEKVMNDMADSQLENGFVPNIAPEYFIAGHPDLKNGFRNSPEWGGAFLMVAWQQYQFTGDAGLLQSYYEQMKRYVSFLASTATDDIVPTGLGDWCDIGPKPSWSAQLTPAPLTATAFYAHFNWILARTAELLGKPDEAREFDRRTEEIRNAFNKKFYHPETHQYGSGSQCANSLALVLDLADPSDRAAVTANIIADVRAKGLTAGDVGYRYLLRALADSGNSDLIYALNNQSDRPGYGYQLKMGATALTEKWAATVDNGYGSQNHFMLGQINEWFFHDLAGIQDDPACPGFKKIIIKPSFVGDLSQARASFGSVRGKITSEWKRNNKRVTMNFTIPVNTSATVFVPAVNRKSVIESGRHFDQSPDVKFVRMEADKAIFTVPAGDYTIQSELR
ncbi:MAG: family 78 glycoside hydrolase catalytic domain [Chthoniobacteraceae bacterium]